jgi:hypothetical protein
MTGPYPCLRFVNAVRLRRMAKAQDTQTPQRGEDDRRTPTNPADDPAPRSPAPDDEAVRKGQENLDSVTTK